MDLDMALQVLFTLPPRLFIIHIQILDWACFLLIDDLIRFCSSTIETTITVDLIIDVYHYSGVRHSIA